MMKHFRHILIGTLLLLTSCIENSIPYPVVTLQILGVEGEGFTCAPEDINTQERIVTLHLDEQTDISNVKIDKISVTENARSSKPLSGTFDLRTPLYLTLSFYQDYEWTIRATQTIERRFSVTGQIGATEIEEKNRIARVLVPSDTDLAHIEVTELKLGPADITTYSPSLEELSGVLWAAAGENRTDGKLTAPSALALYPITVYAIFEEGIYRYDGREQTLTRVAEGDHRAAAGRQPFVATAPLNLVYIADLQTYEGKGIPKENVLMLCAMDAAGYAENVNLYTAGHALRSITRGSAAADELLSLLRLDPARYRFILAQSVGK